VGQPYHPTQPMNPVLCVRNDPDDTLGGAVAVFGEQRLPVVKLDAFEAGARWPGLE